MASYLQLEREIWWGREIQPPALAALSVRLRSFYSVGPAALGSKGDNAHLRGYHRSYAWVRNSSFCTNRSYSCTETPGNRNPGNVNWLAAIDATIPRAQLLAACKRLDAAVRAGRLEKITEWYGNDDGDNRVDGYDNIHNVLSSSDSSHLWHLHMSFDRGRANEDHSDVYAILTGSDSTVEEDMPKLVRVKETGAYWLSNGPWRYWLRTQGDLAEACVFWGLDPNVATVHTVIASQLGAYGVDVNAAGPIAVTLSDAGLAQVVKSAHDGAAGAIAGATIQPKP